MHRLTFDPISKMSALRCVPTMDLDDLQRIQDFGCRSCEESAKTERNYFAPPQEGLLLFYIIRGHKWCHDCGFKSVALIKVDLVHNRLLLTNIRLPLTPSTYAHHMLRLFVNTTHLAAMMQFDVPHPAVTQVDRLYENIVMASVTGDDLDCCGVCTVCLADFVLTDTITKLSCGHFFHVTCLAHWAKSKSLVLTCPVCRQNIVQEVVESVTWVSEDGSFNLENDIIFNLFDLV